MRTIIIFLKSLLIVSILLLNVFQVKADVQVTAFSIPPSYLVSGKLNVPNPTVKTPFKYSVTLNRGMSSAGGFENVAGASISLVYSTCATCEPYIGRRATNKY